MKVVLYARVSTEKQAKKDLSIPEQIHQMQSYCAQHGHEIVKVYKEEGASARDERRPAFQRMMYELLSGVTCAEGIIVYSRSRFFRDAFKAKYYENKLKKKGIHLISLTIPTENLDTPAGNLVKNIEDAISQYQSDINGVYTLAGMMANARRGYFNGGTPPYGYKVVKTKDELGNLKAKLEICQEEAEIVKMIFTLYVQKAMGTKKIAQILNEQGIKRRNGKEWTKDNILSILRNPVYKGERIFNRYDSKTRKEKPEEE